MFSGSRPRGSSSAPASGKTGNSARQVLAGAGGTPASSEQHGGELAPRGHGGRIVEAPGLEELQQLQPRGVLVPGAVAADDLQQRVGRLLALVRSRSARWPGRSAPGNRPDPRPPAPAGSAAATLALRPFLGQRQRAAGAGDLGMVGELRRHLGQRLPRLVLAVRAPSASGSGRPRRRGSPVPAASSSLNSSPACSARRLRSIAAFASASRSALGIEPPASFSRLSTKRLTSDSGSAPWNRSAIWPCQNAATVGTDCSGRPSWASCCDQRAVLVDVDLHQLHPPAGGAHHLLQRRRELLAGAAPGGPEIDQDGNACATPPPRPA